MRTLPINTGAFHYNLIWCKRTCPLGQCTTIPLECAKLPLLDLCSPISILDERYRFHYQQHVNDISLFDGILPMLHALRERQHVLTVATGKSRKGLTEALNTVQLQGLFDASRTADETAGKPNPLMLQELMGEFGVPPARTLMVGDTTHDLEMAKRAGCPSVGVSYGAHDHSEFAVLQPRFVAHTVRELHDWLLVNG